MYAGAWVAMLCARRAATDALTVYPVMPATHAIWRMGGVLSHPSAWPLAMCPPG